MLVSGRVGFTLGKRCQDHARGTQHRGNVRILEIKGAYKRRVRREGRSYRYSSSAEKARD